uniref:uncharacterized protein LOC125388713 n=1 Tax=Myodes glareolus TaxID=447135 RepID=UPI0020218F61|nr:uncharacterized protein LOC125388713 [Myodes glareolus]
MGNNCLCKVIPEDSQLPAPQEELATSSKVVPKKKSYRKTKRNLRHCKPSHSSGRSAAEPRGDAGSSSSSAEVAPVEKPAGFINTESYKDSRISEMGTVRLVEKSCGSAVGLYSLEENSVENEMNTNEMDADDIADELDADDLEEDDSGSGMESEDIRPSDQGYGSETYETEDIDSMTDTSSGSLESEHSIDVLSDKDQMKTTPKEETNTSPNKVQSRKCRWIRSMMRRLGLWYTKSSSIRPQTPAMHMIEKACNTSEDMFPDIDDNNPENDLSPEASLNCEDRESCEEVQMKTLQEASEPALVAVKWPFLFVTQKGYLQNTSFLWASDLNN